MTKTKLPWLPKHQKIPIGKKNITKITPTRNSLYYHFEIMFCSVYYHCYTCLTNLFIQAKCGFSIQAHEGIFLEQEGTEPVTWPQGVRLEGQGSSKQTFDPNREAGYRVSWKVVVIKGELGKVGQGLSGAWAGVHSSRAVCGEVRQASS